MHLDSIKVPAINRNTSIANEYRTALKTYNKIGMKFRTPLINNKLWPDQLTWISCRSALINLEEKYSLQSDPYPDTITSAKIAHQIRLQIQNNARRFS